MNFEGRVALVTGAGAGLGFEYAKLLAERGARVVLNELGCDFSGQGSDQSVAENAANQLRELGGEVIANSDSVVERQGAQRMIDQAMDTWGQIDIVINNAGTTSIGGFPDETKEAMNRAVEVSLWGAINTITVAWPHMEKSNYGRIINIGSNSTMGFTASLGYPAAKGAIYGLTRSLKMAAGNKNILINAILPVAISRLTQMLPPCSFGERLKNNFPAAKVAPVAAFLAHECCNFSGEFFSVGGGYVSRVVFAETGTYYSDEFSLEGVAGAMDNIMCNENPLTVMHSTQDDLRIMGFTDEDFTSIETL